MKPPEGVRKSWVWEAMEKRHGASESTDGTDEAISDETDERSEGRLNRRSVLKGTAAAGLAGSGLAGTASAQSFDEVRFCAAGRETFSFFMEVSGELKRGGSCESDEFDEVGENFVEGAVSEGRCDCFLFNGDVEKLRLDGPGVVKINGKVVEDTTEPDLSNTITIEAGGERVDYKFRVSGQVAKGPEAGTLGVDQILDGNVVRGEVGGTIEGNEDPVDVYRYSGSICFDEASGPLTVTLDINP